MHRPACLLIASGLALWSCTEQRDVPAGDVSVDSMTDSGTDPDPDPDPDPEPDPEPDPDPVCGDGVVEGDESCDGVTLACPSVDPAYVAGTAACLGDCTGFDESECLTFDEMAALVRTAAEITGQALMDVMGLDLVGMYEWEVKEVIDASFLANGADSEPAFPHIVASGPNALELHYAGGERLIQDGDLVLIDIGAKHLGYCGDITRTIPANGVFTDRQRELYQLVLDTEEAAAAAWRPGVHSLDDMYFFAAEYMRASPLRALDEYGLEQTMDVFFIHALSHYIGTDVHGGDLVLNPGLPAEVGHVFSIEPGLYIPSEGIGIRLEDDYILTTGGAVDLAPGTPKTVEAIEATMAAGGSGLVLEIPSESPYMHGGWTDHMDFGPAGPSP